MRRCHHSVFVVFMCTIVSLAQVPEPNHVVTIASPFASGGFGTRIHGVGDYDNDGFADYVVTAPSAPFMTGEGLARIFSGRTSAMILQVLGDQPNSRFGYGVADLGDTNGDGVPDLAIGAPHHDALTSNGGRVFVFSGGMTGQVAWTHDENAMGGEFGQSVAALSDLNGDTVRDLLVTQPGFGTTGRIVFLDGATGSVLGVIDGPAGASRMGLTVAAEGGTIYAGDAGGRVYIVGTPVGGLGTATLLLPAPAGAAAPAQLALIRNPVAGHDLAVGRPFTDAPATNAGSVALHVGGNPIPLFTFMGSYVAEGVGGLIAAMRDVDGDGEEEILFLSAAQGFLASGRVRIMNRAGTIVRDQILTGATGSTSWFSSIPDVTGDGRGEWLAGIVNGVAALSQGEVWASGLSLPGLSIGAAGLAATFAIDLGSGQGGRTWIQAYGISGTAPGTNFGGGMPLVPLNFDIITDYVFSLAGTPFFPDIVGTLSPAGGGSPTLNLPPAAVSLLQGLQLSTVVAAYDVPTLTITGVSNPITIPIP